MEVKCSEAGTCSAISFADSCAGRRIWQGVGFLEVRPAYQMTVCDEKCQRERMGEMEKRYLRMREGRSSLH